MRLSFSTKGWHGRSFEDFSAAAKGLHFNGFEIHNINNESFCGKSGALNPAHINATARGLYEQNLCVPCVDTIINAADRSAAKDVAAEIERALMIAAALKSPYIRIRAIPGAAAEEDVAAVIACLKKALPLAENKNTAILVETSGLFADTKRLLGVLNTFSSDHIAALWDFHSTFRIAGESAEETIKTLGAYVKHVHVKDSMVMDGGKAGNGGCADSNTVFCLIGEGTLPVSDMMLALKSINYDGFIALEWDPQWLPGVDDLEIILSHFSAYMSGYSDPDKGRKNLYDNNARTGKYVWKKETLIDLTFSGVLDRMVSEFPDQYAFKYPTLDYTRTYSQFRDDVDEFARALVSMNVKAGTHVTVWATNVPQWFIAFWATVKIGAVLVTANTAYKIHEMEYLLRQSDTHTLIMIESYRDSNYKGIVEELCPELEKTDAGQPLHSKRLPFLRNIITIGFRMNGCLKWEEALRRAGQVPYDTVRRMAAKVSSRDVCNMQYTSGTTGFPKGVMLTHYNIVNNGKNIGDRMDLSTADRLMIQVPMFHCFGMVLAMTAAMTHGTSLYPLPYFSPKPALACINRDRITAFHGVPTMFISLLEHPDFSKTDFSYMRTGIMAGSPCPVSVMKDVVGKMKMDQITIVYGQTEASPGCTMSSVDDPLEVRVATVGRPLPEIECRIVDPETGKDCPDEVTGEFVVRGYNIMKGYYKMPAATAAAIDGEGWLHTGDLACRTKDGNYKITGRLKDMIIRGGENIYPKEIEEFIYTHPKVRDVQVIGVPDVQYGEEIMACIILKEGETLSEAEMKSFIKASMARHKVPKYIDFVTEFPTNAAGKIMKYKMREDAVIKLKLQKAASVVTA